MWTVLTIFIAVGFLLLFFFFAGARRRRSQNNDPMPEEYLSIICDCPPEYFVPRPTPTELIEYRDEEKPSSQSSTTMRAVQFFGYQKAKLDSKLKRLEVPKRLRRAKLAYRVVDLLGIRKSAKLAGTGYRVKRKVLLKTQA